VRRFLSNYFDLLLGQNCAYYTEDYTVLIVCCVLNGLCAVSLTVLLLFESRRYPDSCDEVNAVLPKREFFMLFDELFSTQPKLSTDLHASLLHVYPRLKVSLQRGFFSSLQLHICAVVKKSVICTQADVDLQHVMCDTDRHSV